MHTPIYRLQLDASIPRLRRANLRMKAGSGRSIRNAILAAAALILTAGIGRADQIAFEYAAHAVNEQDGYRSVYVKRTGGSAGTVSVGFATADGTATVADGDYVASTGTLVFANGETQKVITVQVANAGVDAGNETFSLTLTGPSAGGITTTVFTINDTPTVGTISDQTTTIGTPVGPLAFSVGDAETAAGDLTVTASSANPILLPNGNISLGGSGASRNVTLTPAAGQSGAAQVTILVSDAGGAVVVRQFNLRAGAATVATKLLQTTPIPDVVMTADDTFTLNYNITSASWVTTVTRSNANLFNAPGTGTGSDLRTQPTSGGTDRTLRIRPSDNSTAVGDYGTSTVTLAFTGSSPPAARTFNVRVNPRAVADNQLLAIPGTTSTFDLLGNDGTPNAGHTFSITSVSTPANGTLTITPDGKYVRYTPTNPSAYFDTFTYTVTVASADVFNGFTFTGIGYVKIGGYVVIDTPTASTHTDLDFDYINGSWQQRIRADVSIIGAVQSGTFSPTILDSDEGALFFDPSTRQTLAAGSTLDTLGPILNVSSGDSVWLGPANSSGNKIYLGIANESTTAVDSYLPSGDPRVPVASSYLRTDLVGFSGPGHFAAFNGAEVAFDTYDGLNSINDTAVGNNPTDTHWGFAGSHAHQSWYFTAPGKYELSFRSIVRVGGVFVTSPVSTFSFYVDSMAGGVRQTENPPLPRPDSVAVAEDSGTTILSVLTNDTSDADSYEVLAVSAVTQGANGNVAITGGGSGVSYTPAANFNGSNGFTYTITDEHGGTATTTVSITVTPVNDAPSFIKGADRLHSPDATTPQTVTGWATAITDGDPELAQSLSFQVNILSGAGIFVTPPAISSDGTLTYTLNGVADIAQLSVVLTDDAAAGGPALSSAPQTFAISSLLATEPTTQASAVTFANVQAAQMDVVWTPGSGASRLVICRAVSAPSGGPVDAIGYTADANFSGTGSSLGGGKVVYAGSGSSFTLTGLSASTTYHLQVFEFNGGAGTANYLLAASAGNPASQATTSALDAPAAHAATAVSPTSFQANWSAVSGATGYRIDVANDSGFSSMVSGYNNLGVGSVTLLSVTGLTEGHTYYYRVRAEAGATTSAYSYIVSVTLPATATIPITTLPPNAGNGTVTFMGTAGAQYDVYFSDSDPSGAMVWTKHATITGSGASSAVDVPEDAQRYFKVVVAGANPTTSPSPIWGVIKPTVPSGYSMQGIPVDLNDRSLVGELGNILKAGLANGSKLHFLEPSGAFTTITLVAGDWDTSYTALEGQGFFVENAGSAYTPRFAGPIGNDGTAIRTINPGTTPTTGRWNILGLSQGRTLAALGAFATTNFNGTPTPNWNRNFADNIAYDANNDGVFERAWRTPAGSWVTPSGSAPNWTLPPGSAVYYFRYGNESLNIEF